MVCLCGKGYLMCIFPVLFLWWQVMSKFTRGSICIHKIQIYIVVINTRSENNTIFAIYVSWCKLSVYAYSTALQTDFILTYRILHFIIFILPWRKCAWSLIQLLDFLDKCNVFQEKLHQCRIFTQPGAYQQLLSTNISVKSLRFHWVAGKRCIFARIYNWSFGFSATSASKNSPSIQGIFFT